PNVARFTPQAPCSTLDSAVLVGRVKDASNKLLGVSRLENVSLMDFVGGTLVMPAFDATPQVITRTFHNVPRQLDWTIGYAHGDEELVLDRAVMETTDTGEIALEVPAYLAGDASMFNATLLDFGGTHSTYHGFEPGLSTHFELDAATMMTSILRQSVT